MAEYDPEIHTTKRESARRVADVQKDLDAANTALEDFKAAQEVAIAAHQTALEASQAETKAAQALADKAAQEVAQAALRGVLVQRGITDPVDQEDTLSAHTRRGGKDTLEEWLDGEGAKDRAVVRILASVADSKEDSKEDTDEKEEGDGMAGPPKTNKGAQGDGGAGKDPKVLDRLGDMRTIAELRGARDQYLSEYMGEGYTPPSTHGTAGSLAARAAAEAEARAKG